jgi:hypothetical protein
LNEPPLDMTLESRVITTTRHLPLLSCQLPPYEMHFSFLIFFFLLLICFTVEIQFSSLFAHSFRGSHYHSFVGNILLEKNRQLRLKHSRFSPPLLLFVVDSNLDRGKQKITFGNCRLFRTIMMSTISYREKTNSYFTFVKKTLATSPLASL